MEVLVMYWFQLLEMDVVTRVQILYEAVCFSHRPHTLEKDMTAIFNLSVITGLGEGKR